MSRLIRFLKRLNRTSDHRKRFEFHGLQCSLGLYNFNDDGDAGRWSIELFGLWVRLGRARYPAADPDHQFDSWSIQVRPFGERSIYLHWRARYKFVHLPWSADWISTEQQNSQGKFVIVEKNVRGSHSSYKLNDPLPPVAMPFLYVTKDGEYQHTTVMVQRIERRTWQWAMFRRLRLPLMRFSRMSLDIRFADEMGSRRGLWKGGVLGTGCTFLPDDTIENSVRRYERRVNLEYDFCR